MTLSQADIDSLLGSQPADDVGSLLDRPSTGEDIATALQDPTFTPTVDQYKQFEEYNKTKQTDWLQTVLSAADSITQTAGQAAKAAVTTGAALNPKNYLEGLAQGTAQLYGLVAQSQNPDSPLFKLNNLISGTGSVESRYDQFIQARQFNKDLDAYAKGDMTIMFPPEQLNPEFVQGVAMVADPTMFLPGIGQALGVEKVGAKAVGKAAQIAGRGVQAVARPVEMAAGAAERAITGITGVSPEALRGGLATSGVLAATGAAPAVGLIGAVPLAAAGAMDVGRAIEAAGTQLGRAPTRIGALESIGKIPEANLRQRVIGTIGRYGGDAALNAALVGTTGSLEGAAIGGALGYLSGGEEGAAAGIGSGAAAGALGSLGARGVQTLTGQQARAARLNDLTTYIDTLPENKKAAYQTVQERFGTDTASNLMDLETAIRGTRSDIAVDLLTGDEFRKQAGVTARGIVPQENAPTPRILINVDAFSRGKGDTPIYTLGHELVHALASTKQFQGDVTALTERLTGAYIPNPDGTMRLTAEGEYTPAKVEELFNQYVNKLPDEVKAKTITDNPTAADRAAYVGEELVAEQVGRILSAQKPDAFLRGFGTTRQSFTDMLILQDASRAASRIGQYFEKTFGVTPSDSILFPEIKQSSPILDASLRQLLKARENISEALQKAEFQKSFAINQNNISDPTVADFAVRGGFAVREPDGTVRLLTNGELLDREQRDVRQVKEIVDKLPGARFDIDGNLVGQLSKEQADALNASSVSSQMKERITAVNQAINEGRSVLNEYYPATEKKQDPQSKRWRTRYAGRRMTFRETLFYNLLFSKEGNAFARGIDLTKIRSSLQKHVRNGGVAGLWPDVGAFMGDLAAYLTNRERGENAIPTRQLLGPDKAEFMGSFLNNIEKGGSEFIHAFRLDRFGKMDAGDFRARFGETGYQGMKNRLMPAGTVGDAEAFKSQSGYTVLAKNNKFRLYGPDGALLGIYDSSQKAEKKIYATEARLQPEIDQLQRPARNEVRQTPEAGGRNRIERRTQGGEEGGEALGQVRQAGDVGRFMPSDTDYLAAVQDGDTQAAQQMVDQAAKAAGYTIKAYHGTTHGGFTEFNVPIENDPEYPVRGIFFSTDKTVPEQFTKRSAYDKEKGKSPMVYNAYLKLEKPLVYREKLSSLSEAERKNVAEINKDDLESLEYYIEDNPNDTVADYLYQGGASTAEHLDGSAINYNYDGIIDSSVVIALDPSQIKSADPITRDNSGNVIPLSQRFQQSSADIRYMPSEADSAAMQKIKEELQRLSDLSDQLLMKELQEKNKDIQDQLLNERSIINTQRLNLIKQLDRLKVPFYDEIKSSVTPGIGGQYEMLFPHDISDFVIYRGESDYPSIESVREVTVDNSRISKSFYPLVELSLSNGSKLWQLIRVSDHPQVSRNAPHEYSYDVRFSGNPYRGKNYTKALQAKISEELESLVSNVWNQQREILKNANQPRFMPQPDPSVPGAYSVTGGFRILPGKTGGRLRVYGPSGALVGIAGSLDEAQRMIRRKTKSN